MTKAEYDATILAHYSDVAEESGLEPSSTMKDLVTRGLETQLVLDFVAASARRRTASANEHLRIADVGCGNGYSLERLSETQPDAVLHGFEFSPEMRALAEQRFKDSPVAIAPGDVREPESFAGQSFDVVLCQRVLINLLSPEDQAQALHTLVAATRPGGALLFIECFQSGQDRLNEGRAEFELPPLPPAHHNLYLDDDFFAQAPTLRPFEDATLTINPNFLSTHYYLARVLHPVLLGEIPFKRNAPFTQFMSQALPPGIGDFSPLKAYGFTKIASEA